jgi:hypothetical protein
MYLIFPNISICQKTRLTFCQTPCMPMRDPDHTCTQTHTHTYARVYAHTHAQTHARLHEMYNLCVHKTLDLTNSSSHLAKFPTSCISVQYVVQTTSISRAFMKRTLQAKCCFVIFEWTENREQIHPGSCPGKVESGAQDQKGRGVIMYSNLAWTFSLTSLSLNSSGMEWDYKATHFSGLLWAQTIQKSKVAPNSFLSYI